MSPSTIRVRGSNFSKNETNLLIRLALKRKTILENKRTNSTVNKDKEKAWEDIEVEFNSSSAGPTTRDASCLRKKYEDIKRQMRKKNRSYMMQSGGGPLSPSSPPPMSEEEKELKQLVDLSCEGVQLSEFETDAYYAQAIDPDYVLVKREVCEAQVAEEEEEDWNGFSHSGMLPIPVHPLLEEQEPNHGVQEPNLRFEGPGRRRTVPKRRSKPSTSSKCDAVTRKKIEILEIKKRTALLEESTAKINNAAAKVNLKLALANLKHVDEDAEFEFEKDQEAVKLKN